MFSVGDVLYTKVQYAGLSYHYEFGIAKKITKTGKFRVYFLESTSYDHPQNYKDMMSSSHAIKPSERPTGKNVLATTEGYYGTRYATGRFYFEKYDPSVTLFNYFNFLD